MVVRFDSLATLIGAVIAVLAQIIIAPNIAIFSAIPNFILAYVLVTAIVRPAAHSTLVLAFVLGLMYDLLGQGPVGAMSFLLVLAAFVASRLFMVMNNDTLFMPVTMIVVGALIVEIVYAALMIGFGISASFLEAFVYRALPCALYDSVFGLLFYPLALRFLVEASVQKTPAQARTTVQSTLTTQPQIRKSKSKMRRR